MLTQAQAEQFAAEWIAAWNSHDLARVLEHYAEDFELSSPFIVAIAGEPSGRLHGKLAIAAYWSRALARIPELRFELVSVLRGVRSVVLHYRMQDGRGAAEWLEFGADGRVCRSAAHYAD
jgi:hypothetical protein